MKNIYEKNYERLEKILGDLSELKRKQNLKLEAKSFMDLHIDILSRNENGFVFSMAHYYEQNGDLVPDPDMVIEINLTNKSAEALSVQDTYVYQEVYVCNDKGEKISVRPLVKSDLNSFLRTWTKNIIEQGHKITEIKAGE